MVGLIDENTCRLSNSSNCRRLFGTWELVLDTPRYQEYEVQIQNPRAKSRAFRTSAILSRLKVVITPPSFPFVTV